MKSTWTLQSLASCIGFFYSTVLKLHWQVTSTITITMITITRTCFSSKFGHQVALLVLSLKLSTRWCHLHHHIVWDWPMGPIVHMGSIRINSKKKASLWSLTTGQPFAPNPPRNETLFCGLTNHPTTVFTWPMKWTNFLMGIYFKRFEPFPNHNHHHIHCCTISVVDCGLFWHPRHGRLHQSWTLAEKVIFILILWLLLAGHFSTFAGFDITRFLKATRGSGRENPSSGLKWSSSYFSSWQTYQ